MFHQQVSLPNSPRRALHTWQRWQATSPFTLPSLCTSPVPHSQQPCLQEGSTLLTTMRVRAFIGLSMTVHARYEKAPAKKKVGQVCLMFVHVLQLCLAENLLFRAEHAKARVGAKVFNVALEGVLCVGPGREMVSTKAKGGFVRLNWGCSPSCGRLLTSTSFTHLHSSARPPKSPCLPPHSFGLYISFCSPVTRRLRSPCAQREGT